MLCHAVLPAPPRPAGQFVQLMGLTEASTLRCAMLRALLATRRGGTRAKLLHYGGFLATLETWLREGEADQQATLLHLLLQVHVGSKKLERMLSKSRLGVWVGRGWSSQQGH
jgi:hypothetical protein